MCAGGLVLVLEDAFAPPEDVASPLLTRLPLPWGDPGFPAAYRLPQPCRPVLHYPILDRQRCLHEVCMHGAFGAILGQND